MTTEIRSCRDDAEMKDYRNVIAYVFADDGENVNDEVAATLPDWTTCAWVDGTMACTMGTFPFTLRLNGAPVKTGGVTAVGTLPPYRRQGLLRQVMRAGFETMHERGQSIAILWASMGAIYQRFGYGKAAAQANYDFDPRYAQFESPMPSTGTTALFSKEDGLPIAKRLWVEYATPRNLALHRSTPLWEAGTLRPAKKGQPVYIAVYRNSAGEPRGYVIYDTRNDESLPKPGPNQVLDVRDFIALDMEAYRGLWEYVRRHDLVARVTMKNALPDDDPAPDLLLEPRLLNRATLDAIWMRIVDVEQAIPQRPYGDRGQLTFALPPDDMCPWNGTTFLMETDGKTTEVRRTDRAPQFTMRVNSLATLLAGHRSATHLFRAGLIEAADKAALTTADRLFRTEYGPHCPNGF